MASLDDSLFHNISDVDLRLNKILEGDDKKKDEPVNLDDELSFLIGHTVDPKPTLPSDPSQYTISDLIAYIIHHSEHGYVTIAILASEIRKHEEKHGVALLDDTGKGLVKAMAESELADVQLEKEQLEDLSKQLSITTAEGNINGQGISDQMNGMDEDAGADVEVTPTNGKAKGNFSFLDGIISPVKFTPKDMKNQSSHELMSSPATGTTGSTSTITPSSYVISPLSSRPRSSMLTQNHISKSSALKSWRKRRTGSSIQNERDTEPNATSSPASSSNSTPQQQYFQTSSEENKTDSTQKISDLSALLFSPVKSDLLSSNTTTPTQPATTDAAEPSLAELYQLQQHVCVGEQCTHSPIAQIQQTFSQSFMPESPTNRSHHSNLIQFDRSISPVRFNQDGLNDASIIPENDNNDALDRLLTLHDRSISNSSHGSIVDSNEESPNGSKHEDAHFEAFTSRGDRRSNIQSQFDSVSEDEDDVLETSSFAGSVSATSKTQLRRRVADLTKKIHEVEKHSSHAIRDYEDKIEHLNLKIEELKNEVASKKKEVNEMKNAEGDYFFQIEELEGRAERFQLVATQSRAVVGELREQVDELLENEDKWNQLLESKEEEIARLTAELDEVMKEYTKALEENEQLFTNLTAAEARLQELETLQAELEVLKEENQGLQESVDKLKSEREDIVKWSAVNAEMPGGQGVNASGNKTGATSGKQTSHGLGPMLGSLGKSLQQELAASLTMGNPSQPSESDIQYHAGESQIKQLNIDEMLSIVPSTVDNPQDVISDLQQGLREVVMGKDEVLLKWDQEKVKRLDMQQEAESLSQRIEELNGLVKEKEEEIEKLKSEIEVKLHLQYSSNQKSIPNLIDCDIQTDSMSAQTIDRTCQTSIPTSSSEIQCDILDPLNSKFLNSVSQMVNDPSNPFSTASQSTSDFFNQPTKVQTSQDNDIAALESKISELETENVSLNLEVEELRSSLAKVQATLNSREWQLKELSHRIRGVENGVESIENWEQVIDSIRNEIVQSKSLSDKLKAELEKLQSENDILQKEKVHAESRQEDLESEVRKLEADLIAAKVNENNLQNTLTMINEGTVQGARDIRKDRKLRRRGLSSIQEADDDPLALQSHRYTSKRGATASRGWYRHWFMICIFVLAAIVGTQIWGALTTSRAARIKKRALSTLAESSFELFEEVLVDSSSIAGLGHSPIDGSWIGLEDESSYWWTMQGSDLEGISGEDIPT